MQFAGRWRPPVMPVSYVQARPQALAALPRDSGFFRSGSSRPLTPAAFAG